MGSVREVEARGATEVGTGCEGLIQSYGNHGNLGDSWIPLK